MCCSRCPEKCNTCLGPPGAQICTSCLDDWFLNPLDKKCIEICPLGFLEDQAVPGKFLCYCADGKGGQACNVDCPDNCTHCTLNARAACLECSAGEAFLPRAPHSASPSHDVRMFVRGGGWGLGFVHSAGYLLDQFLGSCVTAQQCESEFENKRFVSGTECRGAPAAPRVLLGTTPVPCGLTPGLLLRRCCRCPRRK